MTARRFIVYDGGLAASFADATRRGDVVGALRRAAQAPRRGQRQKLGASPRSIDSIRAEQVAACRAALEEIDAHGPHADVTAALSAIAPALVDENVRRRLLDALRDRGVEVEGEVDEGGSGGAQAASGCRPTKPLRHRARGRAEQTRREGASLESGKPLRRDGCGASADANGQAAGGSQRELTDASPPSGVRSLLAGDRRYWALRADALAAFGDLAGDAGAGVRRYGLTLPARTQRELADANRGLSTALWWPSQHDVAGVARWCSAVANGVARTAHGDVAEQARVAAAACAAVAEYAAEWTKRRAGGGR